MKALQGSWVAEEGVEARFEENSLSFSTRLGPGLSYRVTIDASARPKSIDLKAISGAEAGRTYHGIYGVEKGVFRLCCKKSGEGRPASFAAKDGECDLFLFTRAKP